MASTNFTAESAAIPDVEDAGAIVLGGRLTIDQAPAVRQALLERLRDSDATRIVFELSGVERLDTAGAAVLAEALKFGQDHGKRVVLCQPSESVLKIFRLAGFEEVLECCCRDATEAKARLTA